jgi:DNA polymerase-3 subunit beta
VIKPVFNGIFITSANGMLSTVASDSRRLSAISRTVENVVDMSNGVVVPLKTVGEVQKLLGAGTCHLSMSGNQFFFKIGDTEIVSRLIDGQFPNYTQVIPKDFSFRVTVPAKKLIEALRRVMIFTREPAFKVLMYFSAGNLKLEAQTAELGEAMEELPVEMDKPGELVIGVNSQYLMDALREVDSHSVQIGVTGDKSPMVVIPDNDENHVSVIMPIQLKNND